MANGSFGYLDEIGKAVIFGLFVLGAYVILDKILSI